MFVNNMMASNFNQSFRPLVSVASIISSIGFVHRIVHCFRLSACRNHLTTDDTSFENDNQTDELYIEVSSIGVGCVNRIVFRFRLRLEFF